MELGIANISLTSCISLLADANIVLYWPFPPRASVVAPSQQTLDEMPR